MSTSKLDTSGVFESISLQLPQSPVRLTPDAVCIRKNGIELRLDRPLKLWTELTLDLESPPDGKRVHCRGIVVACKGTPQTGYVVSLVFTNLSRQSQARLSALAFSPSA